MDYAYVRPRKELVKLLAQKGITDTLVLSALEKVERHLFIPDSALRLHAYEDKAFPIAAGQTISQPYTVAYQSQLLEAKPGMRILEIGTGSGYQAAVLAEMNMEVYSIERQKELYKITTPLLKRLGYSIRTWHGDGYKGKPVYAPYDRVLVTAAAPYVPEALLEQLTVDGCLVIPLDNDSGSQTMLRIWKRKSGYEEETFEEFRFVPMLTGRS